MAVRRQHGQNNQEGTLTPTTSPYGQAYLAYGVPQAIAHPAPIGRQSRGFRGTIGGIATRSASVIALFAPGGYWGDLPLSEQSTVDAASPWERP